LPFRPLLFALGLALAACGGSAPRAATFVATQDPLTRLVPSGPASILEAGRAALREMGFDVTSPEVGATRVYSEQLIVQSTWRGEPVSRRIVCGIGTAAASEPGRVVGLSNTIPIEVQLGYEVQARAESTATAIIFNAQGRRANGEPLTSPAMSCTLTVPFVNELFAVIEANLAATVRATAAAP
jgi:hypothetical protein